MGGCVAVSTWTTSRVRVEWANGTPTCESAATLRSTTVELGPDGERVSVELAVSPATRCTFTVKVTNPSALPVHLGSAAFDLPLLRTAPIRVESVAGRKAPPDIGDSTLEAGLGQRLAGHATRSFRVVVAYDPTVATGCGDDSGTTTVTMRQFVSVRTRVLGIRHTSHDDGELRLRRKGEANCG